ncbi:MAG: hypothetical protein HQK75_04485 [Candidatus Magnetomorum sp.]|nr:hypothetical protein [Candidatus Magnetomorum sp.]
MKQAILWIMIIVMVPAWSFANLGDGCIAYYSFNGDWVDGSPMDEAAVPSGNPLFMDGKKGQAIYLNGMDDYITLGIHQFIDQFSISFWVNFPELKETWQPLVSRYDEASINNTTLLKHTFYLKVLGEANAHRIYFAVSENGQQSSDIISHLSMMPQTWYHIVAMFQEGKILLYINGQKETEKQTPFQQLYTSSIPTLVGSMFSDRMAKGPFANIVLDELRLYQRNLSESEILFLYEKKSGPKIIQQSPTGMLSEPISYVDISFDQPILSTLFTSDDLFMMGPEDQILLVEEPEQLSLTLYRLGFPEQSATGRYTIQIGPQIIDVAGNALNQDQDDINGESEDIYLAEFQLNVLPDTVLVINFSGSFDDTDALNIYNTLLEAGATGTYINLSSEKNESMLVALLSNTDHPYQQVWVFDASEKDGLYPNALAAISEWFLEKKGRQIICDGRMRSSYWTGQWEKNGQLLTENYYENLKINGGGLVLGTDNPNDQPDINSICDQINIAHFGDFAGYKTVQTDLSCHLISYPHELGESLGTTSRSSMVPTGRQPNDLYLYCVAWEPDYPENCNISTTLIPLIPTGLTSQVDTNIIELTWKPAKPETQVSHYNVYAETQFFSSITGLTPVQSNISTIHTTLTSLQYKATYYLAATAVDHLGNERYEVFPISATTGLSPRSSRGGGGGGGCFFDLITRNANN